VINFFKKEIKDKQHRADPPTLKNLLYQTKSRFHIGLRLTLGGEMLKGPLPEIKKAVMLKLIFPNGTEKTINANVHNFSVPPPKSMKSTDDFMASCKMGGPASTWSKSHTGW